LTRKARDPGIGRCQNPVDVEKILEEWIVLEKRILGKEIVVIPRQNIKFGKGDVVYFKAHHLSKVYLYPTTSTNPLYLTHYYI